MAAEVHQRLIEEEKKESPPLDSKEKSPQSGANKKAKKEKEAPKKKKAEKKGKGIQGGRTGYPGLFEPLDSKQAFNQAYQHHLSLLST